MPPRRGPRATIEKNKNYMTRDAVRRLTLAKRAAKEVLASGGSAEAAALAAQQYGALTRASCVTAVQQRGGTQAEPPARECRGVDRVAAAGCGAAPDDV